MLKAMEPGTVMPIRRNRICPETVMILRGKSRWIFFNDNGNETERVLLDAESEPCMLNVEKDRRHALEYLTPAPPCAKARMVFAYRWKWMRIPADGYEKGKSNTKRN